MKTIQRIYNDNIKTSDHISFEVENTLKVISKCRSGELGYHKKICEDCKEITIKANSCRNRHCPICQKQKKEDWVYNKKTKIINCRYYHIVATIPNSLYQIFRQNQEEMYKILMQTSAKAIIEIARDKKWMGVNVGILQILHTWTQKIDYHPHTHMLVTMGGLNEYGEWQDHERDYFVPVKVLSKVFRRLFIKEIKKVKEKLKFYNKAKKYENKEEWKKFIKELNKKGFVTYIKEPYNNADTVIEYFGRYAYNVGISNSRIKSYEAGKVTFTYKDRKDKGKEKIKIITGKEFVEKMSLHVLPKGFRKIRTYGILANRNLDKRSKEINTKIKNKGIREELRELKARINYRICEKCGSENCSVEYKISLEELRLLRKKQIE